MQDYLQDCMEDFRRKASLTTAVSPSEFKELWCSKCQQACVNARFGDPFVNRIASQFDRLTRPNQADPHQPKYASIVAREWADMTREALKLEVADRRGDWEVPEIDITDGTPQVATRGGTSVVDQAVRNLAQAQGRKAPELPEVPSDDEEFSRDAAALLEEKKPEPVPPRPPAPQHSKKNPSFRPSQRGNAPAQEGMLDGSPIPNQEPEDPWAAPPSTTEVRRKVQPGAVIKFGAGGEIADDG